MKSLGSTTQKKYMPNALHEMLAAEGQKIKAEAKADGQFLAARRPSLPQLKGDSLIHYIAPIKARCEQLAMKVLQLCQPASHLPNGRIDTEWAKMYNRQLQDEIDKINIRLQLLLRELGSFNPAILANRIKYSILIGILLFVGEVVLNTQAFQVTGDSLISCLILALSASVAICLGAHYAGRKYKDASTKRERWTIILVSVIGMGIFSAVIASMRSLYFKKAGIDVSPLYFTVFNMVFFLIAAFATWYNHPTKEELEANREKLQKHKEVNELKKQLKAKTQEQTEHGNRTKEQVKENIRAQLEAEYALATVNAIYNEAVEEFRMANIMSRTDIPDCIREQAPLLNIPHITVQSTLNKFKTSNHENSNSTYLA